MLIKTNPVPNNPESVSEDPGDLSSSMTNYLDSESDHAYCPSRSLIPSSPLRGSNRSSCKLVDMAPKRSRKRPVSEVPTYQGWDADANAGPSQAGPSDADIDLQAMRPEWENIRDIGNLLWVLAPWLNQVCSITNRKQLKLVERMEKMFPLLA
jgi:hypothetical protein